MKKYFLWKKSTIILSVIFIIVVSCISVMEFPSQSMRLEVNFNDVADNSVTQCYFDLGDGFSEENSCSGVVANNKVVIDIPRKYYKPIQIRFDPTNSSENTTITNIKIFNYDKELLNWDGKDIVKYIESSNNIKEMQVIDNSIKIIPQNEDVQTIFNNVAIKKFKAAANYDFNKKVVLLTISIIIFLIILFREHLNRIVVKILENIFLKKWIYNENIICVGLVIFVILYLFKDIIFNGYKLSYTNIIYSAPPFNSLGIKIKGPLLSDVADVILPNIYQVFKNFKFLDLWNSSNAFGAANTNFETILHPLNYLYIFGLSVGQFLKYCAKILIGFYGMYLFLKNLKYSKLSSFVGGIVYTFSSVLILWGGWPHSDVACMAPLLFLFVDKYIVSFSSNATEKQKSNRVKYLLSFTVILYFMLVAGMPVYVAYFIYFGFVYLLYRLFSQYPKKYKKISLCVLSLVICIVISGVMSFIYTGNMFFNTTDYQNDRLVQSFATLDKGYLRTIFFPYWRDGLEQIHINESTLFTGLIFPFIIPFLFLKKEKREKRELYFWIISAVVILLFIFVNHTGYIFEHIPLVNTSRKFRIIILFNFIASVISGMVMEYVQKNKIIKEKIVYIITGILILPIIVTIFSYGNINKDVMLNLVSLWVIALFMILTVLFKKRVFLICLTFVICFDMVYFAKIYMPLIDRKADVIPKSTDSIEFLQNNVSQERFIGVGDWNFFANSNVYYGINDIRAHDFVNTNFDMSGYLKAIDDNFYDTATRTSLKKIDNYNLLSYASVKYVLKTATSTDKDKLSEIDSIIQKAETERIPYPIYDETNVIEQIFRAKENGLSSIGILLSTYNKTLSNNDYLNVQIEDCETGETICDKNVLLSEIKDNSIYNVELKNSITNSKEKEYKLTLKMLKTQENPLAIWVTNSNLIDGNLKIGKDEKNGDLVFLPSYNGNKIYKFNDGEDIEELKECSPRVFIADKLLVKDDNNNVLDEMKKEYIPNTIFLEKSEYDKISKDKEVKLQSNIDGESRVVSDNGDSLNINAKISGSSFVVLNDYYNDDWKVYVNGKESKIIKANYLFRAIYLPEAGEYNIQFKYEPKLLDVCIAVTVIGYLIFIMCILFRKKINDYIAKFE